MSQTTAPQINLTAGSVGVLADSFGPKDVLSGKGVASAMTLGWLAVVDGANGDGAVKHPAATGDVTNLAVGLVMHTHSLESGAAGAPAYAIKSAVPVLRKGRVWADVEDAVAEGGQVFARHAAGNLGKLRSDVDGGNATLVPGAVFRTSTAGAGLAVVELNLP